MDYELAKELKDAGFPLIGGWLVDALLENQPATYPTLEELIEACGPRFGGLIQKGAAIKSEDWIAIGKGEILFNIEQIEKGSMTVPDCEVFAPTPTEAVARLWLALNPKKA